DTGLDTGEEAVVVGYPDNGPLRAEAVRVRQAHQLLGHDIYDTTPVTRDVVSVRGRVRSGNSGGPLIDGDGLVGGVVFAASLSDPHTGYALGPAEFSDVVAETADATEP